METIENEKYFESGLIEKVSIFPVLFQSHDRKVHILKCTFMLMVALYMCAFACVCECVVWCYPYVVLEVWNKAIFTAKQ